jgi:trans-aconitate methyltransferase
MEEANQVLAYAQADFDIPHSEFIQRLKVVVNKADFNDTALDLGCGPGDISRRFAESYPDCLIHALDGSQAMLEAGRQFVPPHLQKRIHFILGRLPDVILPQSDYAMIFSNSLLHHLPDPLTLWQFIKKYARSGAYVVIMDLMRPDSIAAAQAMVDFYAGHESQLLQRDFYHSLLAAFTIEEVRQQLKKTELALTVEQVSNRHVFISGVMP